MHIGHDFGIIIKHAAEKQLKNSSQRYFGFEITENPLIKDFLKNICLKISEHMMFTKSMESC